MMIFDKSTITSKEGDTNAIKTADPKYSMPRWCPSGLTWSQKRKLQKRWRPKAVKINQTAMKTQNETTTSQLSAGTMDILAIKAGLSSDDTGHLTLESGPSALRQDVSKDAPIPMEEDNLLEEDLVDYGATPEHSGMDVNVIMFSTDCTIISDDEPVVAQFDFGPKEAAFTNPKESVNHLKPLFMCDHIDGIPIAKMLVDGGAAVNLTPYSYRKSGKQDNKFVKTNMMLSDVGTDSSIKAKGVTSVELTIGTKTLAAAFFVADVEGSYSLILGRNWIHANQCITSTLHPMSLQWVDDDVEQVHADASP
jgi:hypothetical protein